MERAVLITGCSSGIGRAAAQAFRAEGWRVMATARDIDDIGLLAEDGCETAALDVTDETAVDAVIDSAIDTFGQLDCLVNNAGWSQLGPLEDVSTARLHRQFEVNVYGPHRLARAVLPHMRARGDGTIINVSSAIGRHALPGCGAYSASKHALEAMSDALRAEVRQSGVDVVVIEPGTVETSFRSRATRELAGLDRSAVYSPLYRLLDDWSSLDGVPTAIDAEAVADVIVNAASATQPESRYVVGPVAPLVIWSAYLPDRVRDRLYGLLLRATDMRGSG